MAEGIVATLLALSAAATTPIPAGGPPFVPGDQPVHEISMTVDTAPGRDLLVVLAGGPDAPPALRRLRACRPVLRAIEAEGLSVDQFFGRAVAVAAGTPDRVFSPVKAAPGGVREVLAAFDEDGPAAARTLGRRTALLLPAAPIRKTRVTIVPFFGLSSFREMTAIRDADDLWVIADLSLQGSEREAQPREEVLKIVRGAAAETWRLLFDGGSGRPGWDPPRDPFVTLLRQTVLDGTAMLFLVPDEFFPLDLVLSDPIVKSFERWNGAVRALTDPKRPEQERKEILAQAARGDFWSRYPGVVGIAIVDGLLRRSGRDAFVSALGSGPLAVAELYARISKDGRLPSLGKEARRELDARLRGAGSPVPRPVRGPGAAGPD
jgi:hypothetical protein